MRGDMQSKQVVNKRKHTQNNKSKGGQYGAWVMQYYVTFLTLRNVTLSSVELHYIALSSCEILCGVFFRCIYYVTLFTSYDMLCYVFLLCCAVYVCIVLCYVACYVTLLYVMLRCVLL